IVVLAGADVTARSVEMDVQRRRHGQVAFKSGYARKIRVRDAGTVVALRVRRVVAQDSQRFVSIPKADLGEQGIDGALRRGTQLRIGAGRVTNADFAVRSGNAPAGCDFLDLRLTEPNVGNRLRAR